MKDPFDTVTRRHLENQKILVRDGAQKGHRKVAHKLGLRMVVLFVVIVFSSSEWVRIGAVSLFGAFFVMYPQLQALAYRNGWMDGRQDALEQIRHHDSPEGWLNTLVAHDFVHVLGLPPVVPDDLEGLGDQ